METPLSHLIIAFAAIIGLPILAWITWKAWAWVRDVMAYIGADDEGSEA